MTLRVLLVDDQPLLRTGFRLILQSEPDIEVAARRPTARSLSRRCGRWRRTWS